MNRCWEIWGRGLRAAGPYPYEKLPQTPTPNPLSFLAGEEGPEAQLPQLTFSGLGGGCGGRAGASSPWPSPHQNKFMGQSRKLWPKNFLFSLFLFITLLLAGPGGAGPQEFQAARPGRVFHFPRDHGAHPEFKTEWWYYVGHLASQGGEAFGYQLTFFRSALKKPDPQAKSAWALHTIFFAHLALTDVNRRTFLFREKAGRGALGLAGAEAGAGRVWIDSWQAELKGNDFHLKAKDQGVALDLILTPKKAPALHGDGGFSRKAAAPEAAGYYYSLSRLATRGHLTLDGRILEVQGTSWMDHEFFTGSLAPSLVGWDWFALQLDDGAEVMLYLLRRQDGSLDPASSGTLIDPQGRAAHLTLPDFKVTTTATWKSPHSQTTYPAGWEVTIPASGYHLSLTPSLADQEIRAQNPAPITYWEGQVQIQGHKNQQPITGRGYTELTGYAGEMAEWF